MHWVFKFRQYILNFTNADSILSTQMVISFFIFKFKKYDLDFLQKLRNLIKIFLSMTIFKPIMLIKQNLINTAT